MPDTFFDRLTRQTPTRLWVNNPTLDEARAAVAHGAVSCTTNPTYGANMIRRDPGFALGVIDRACAQAADDERAAHLAQREMVRRIMPAFEPLYRRNPGWQGVVSIQGDPRRDTDESHIIAESLDDHRRLPENFIAKIPVTAAGLKAIEHMIAQGIPVIATEVFSLAQTVCVCELYQRTSARCGKSPAFYLTHITGIFDEYLAQYAARNGVGIEPAVLAEAGLISCKAQYRLFNERRYEGMMLGGGARAMRHFTDYVGSRMHITINWSTAQEILAADPPVGDGFDTSFDADVAGELCRKLPDFRKSFELDGLRPEEFAEFGPVQHFRDKFIEGWEHLLATIRQRREGRGR
jgi:transaldolase